VSFPLWRIRSEVGLVLAKAEGVRVLVDLPADLELHPIDERAAGKIPARLHRHAVTGDAAVAVFLALDLDTDARTFGAGGSE
jgi:hypothetical protein